MSKERRRREEKSFEPRCPSCKSVMSEAVLKMHFPRGSLPIAGFKCRNCGEEIIDAKVVEEYQQLAQKLGLYEPEFPLIRTITKSGRQLALYLPKEIEKAFSLIQGKKVRIFTRGDEIIVQPV